MRSYLDDERVREKLARLNDDILETTLYMTKGESSAARPLVIKGEHLFPLLEALVHASGDEGASTGGKVISLTNKTSGPFGGIAPTMLCEVRVLAPGQETKAHRHSMAVVQYVIQGSGKSWIDGQEYTWEKGDIIVYPAWCTHSFRNTGAHPAFFLSITDAPLVAAIGQLRVLPPPQDEASSSLRRPTSHPERRYRDFARVRECLDELEDARVGVFTYLDSVEPPAPIEPIVIRWKKVRALLEALLDVPVQEDPRAGRVIGFYSKNLPDALGTTPTLMVGFQVVPPGRRGLPHRHSVTAIQYIIEGRGMSVIEGKAYEWQAGDIVVTPGGCAHELSNQSETDPAYILGITDLPLMRFMRLLTVEEL